MNISPGFDPMRRLLDGLNSGSVILKRPDVRRELLKHLGQKLAANVWPIAISLMLATAIYLGNHERTSEEFVRNVAVKVAGIPENVRIGIDPPTVRVVFRGSSEDRIRLDTDPPVITLAYRPLGPNGLAVKLKGRDIRFSSRRGFASVPAVRFEPSTVRLVEDTIASMTFPIDPPRLDGTPYRGFRAEVTDYSPREAVVTGGSLRLQAWDSLGYRLQLEPVSVEGRASPFTADTALRFPGGDEEPGIVLPDTAVTVKVSIAPPRSKRAFANVPVRLSLPQNFSFPATLEIEPPSVLVTLVGVEEQLNEVAIDRIAVYAEVATNALPPSATNGFEVALVARIPHDKSISEVNISPDTVRLAATFPAPGLPARENGAPPSANTGTGSPAADSPIEPAGNGDAPQSHEQSADSAPAAISNEPPTRQ